MIKHTLLLIALLGFLCAKAQYITTIAGGGSSIPGNGGTATNCTLLGPTSIAVDAAGNVYICERDGHRVRKVSTDGIITTIAGTGMPGITGNGGSATTALLFEPYCIAVGADYMIYIGDQSGVRKINTSGIISIFAGTSVQGYNGDGIPATDAHLNVASGIATDTHGNVYISDMFNHRIRKVDAAGYIHTIAGTGTAGYSGDSGLATDAAINSPIGIVCVNDNTIYITDYENDRIRRVDSAGIITSVAGNGVSAYNGDGGSATAASLNRPISTATDAAGNLYISDGLNHVVRKVDKFGIITTYAGQGVNPGFSGDGGAATAAKFLGPTGIFVSKTGDLYVCDYNNKRVRLITETLLSLSSNTLLNSSLSIYPVPTNGDLTINITTAISSVATVVITDVLGRVVQEMKLPTNTPMNMQLAAPTGAYNISADLLEGTITKRFIVLK